MKKNFFAILFFAIFSYINLYAEDVSENIFLPDLTTTVQGENSTESPEIEFQPSVEFPLLEGTGNVDVELPEFEIDFENSEIVKTESATEKNIYAEGQISAGLPGFFIGDFSVYRMTGNDPFKIGFNYESAEGYGGKSYSSGYNSNSAKISVEKTLSYKNSQFKIFAKYESFENGLQNKEPYISSIKQRSYFGNLSYLLLLPFGFDFTTKIDLGGYNRFCDILKYDDSYIINSWANSVALFSFSPELKISWNTNQAKNRVGKKANELRVVENDDNGVTAVLAAKYWFDNDLKKSLSESTENFLNRGQFSVGLFWKNEFVKVFGNASAVVGNQINNDVIVPFSIGINSQFPVYFSNRKLKINLCGGLESDRVDVSLLETQNKFSMFSLLPAEQSDWFSTVELNIPIKSSISINVLAEYKRTAFENGIWNVSYNSSNLFNGGYKFIQTDRRFVMTHGTFSYNYKIFTLNAGWLSFWDFVPNGFDRQTVTLLLDFQSTKSTWGISINSIFGIITDDYIPVIDLEAYLRLTNQIKIAVNVNDMIKLFKGELRNYGGQYAAKGGTAVLSLKFFF